MKRKTCKKMLENGVLQAYANGEDIQVYSLLSKSWMTISDCVFDLNADFYRVKPKEEITPFDFKTIQPHLDSWIYFNNGLDDKGAVRIIAFSDTGVSVGSGVCITYDELASDWCFLSNNKNVAYKYCKKISQNNLG